MNRQPVSRIRRQNQINIKERYNQAYKKYVSGEFTYNSHCLLKKMCENGEKQPCLYNVPLYKMMVQITKIMMMNELQLLFFGATVQQMGWKKVDETCLTPYIDEVADITPKITKKDNLVKKMQLSLLLIAYIVKIYLNEDSSLYDFKIRDLVKNNFDKMYQEWVQKVQNHFKFSPKNMNKLFKQLDKGKTQTTQQIVDYNQLVDQLFRNNGGDDDHGYYTDRPIDHNRSIEKQRRRQDDYHHHTSTEKIQGLPVQEEEEQYRMPSLAGRTISNRSHISGFGKRQSYHELFEKGQIKPERNNSLSRNFSNDQDFL